MGYDTHSDNTEVLTDEKKETAAGSWTRANAFFENHGITVKHVITDNGPYYRSGAFATILGETITHAFTRPYRPQTNGKVEQFNRTSPRNGPTPKHTTPTKPGRDLPSPGPWLQSPQNPNRHRRQVTYRTRSQRPKELHLDHIVWQASRKPFHVSAIPGKCPETKIDREPEGRDNHIDHRK
ncbi:transposase family protein [Rathayibacter toxicus]|nr:transposase family protein [Rathayibacter toxicus]QOD10643.1 transposase family protein [Rathayibacter toxicus]